MTLNVSLPPELEEKVHEKVSAGLYQSASDVVHEALKDFFAKTNEGQVFAYFIDQRLNEIQDSGEEFVEADITQLKQIRENVDRKKS